MKVGFVVSSVFLVLMLASNLAWAQTSASSEHGEFSVDKEVYYVERGKTTFAQISGTGVMTDVRPPYDLEKVFITTRTGNHQIFSTEDGYFSLPIPLTDEDLGMHRVFVTFGSNVLGEIYFEVKKSEYVPVYVKPKISSFVEPSPSFSNINTSDFSINYPLNWKYKKINGFGSPSNILFFDSSNGFSNYFRISVSDCFGGIHCDKYYFLPDATAFLNARSEGAGKTFFYDFKTINNIEYFIVKKEIIVDEAYGFEFDQTFNKQTGFTW